ncbi:MAG: hypothetical protein HKN76_13060 [Saprospiraceae bacterium]|nr:hypothetical protein [Saprospiraceae bacterium]
MKTISIIMLVAAVTFGCQKESDLAENYVDSTITWTVGHNHPGDTTVVLPASQAPMNYLSVEQYSICGNTNLQIIVREDKDVILDTVFQDSFTRFPLATHQGKELTVQSKLVLGDSLIYCFWQGQAVIKFEYGT